MTMARGMAHLAAVVGEARCTLFCAALRCANALEVARAISALDTPRETHKREHAALSDVRQRK